MDNIFEYVGYFMCKYKHFTVLNLMDSWHIQSENLHQANSSLYSTFGIHPYYCIALRHYHFPDYISSILFGFEKSKLRDISSL